MAPGDSYPKIMREQHQITKEMYLFDKGGQWKDEGV